jgi:hypothetical protein
MAGKAAKDQAWAEAARRCRLSPAEVRMAKELGFKPRSSLKNIADKAKPWKAPVAEWSATCTPNASTGLSSGADAANVRHPVRLVLRHLVRRV